MKIVHYASGEAEAKDHPWVPGIAFIMNSDLEPLLRALEESGIKTAEELTRRLSGALDPEGMEAARRAAEYHIGDPSWAHTILTAYRNPHIEVEDLDAFMDAAEEN